MESARAQLPRLPRRVLEVLTREEISAMEAVAATERDRLIVRLLADTGIRLGELLGLHLGDLLEPRRGEFAVKVCGKGDRERLVPVPPALFRRLRKYAERGRGDARDEKLFVSLRLSRSGDRPPLTASGVQQLVRVLGITAGIGRPVHPHLFRHSFATHALRRGMDVVSLQRILGHADLSMIAAVYQHLDTGDDYTAMMKVLMD
jgi:integrase/recombinase XerD